MTATAPHMAEARPYHAMPQMSLVETVRSTFGNGGGRVDLLGAMRKLYREKGAAVTQRRGPIKFVNLFGPDANRLVLLDKDQIFSSRRPWMMIMGRIFPNGLLLRDGEEHRTHRRIMQEAFNRPVLKEYLEHMNPAIAKGIEGWESGGREISAFRSLKKLTLEIAASIFVGIDLGAETTAMNKAFEDMVAASMSHVKLAIPGLEFYRGLKGRAFMLGFFGKMIEARRAASGGDMFSRLCHAKGEAGEAFNDQDILDHMIFLMMAAHDTTTSTLTSMTYELGRNPEWQDRIRAESLALGVREAGMEDLEKLPALTLFMRETLRRYPPLPVIPRTATKDFEFAGYKIPAGVMVVIAPILVHHMEEWWSDPFKFDPERFAPGRAEHERHTHSWTPFGGGPHLCLGMKFAETQIRAIMHQLVLRYHWRLDPGYEMPVQQAPISKPRDGLPVRFERIS